MSPCTVDSFDVVSNPIAAVTYTLDDPSFSFGAYAFRQTPDCNYPVTIQAFNLPPERYVFHNETGQVFTI